MSATDQRAIVHMDLDSFFVSVERLKDPSLIGKAIAIGGNQRGVVASCSYEARKYGVHSAMPSVKAKRLCPHIIFVKHDMLAYSKYSRMVTEIIAAKSPLYSKSSIDEFYIDVSGMDKFFGCWKWTCELKQKIMKETGLPISFGLSVNKTVSKIATNECKPSGQLHVPAGTEKTFLAPLPIGKIPHLGKKSEEALQRLGFTTIADIAAAPIKKLEKILGKSGVYFWERANGIDNNPVEPHWDRKSMSSETTFREDTTDKEAIRIILFKIAEELCYDLRKEGLLTGCVTVKIKYSDFEVQSMQATIPYTASDHIVMERVQELFKTVYTGARPLRLAGVRLSHLIHGSQQLSLFENDIKSIQLYKAMDNIRKKFGHDAVGRAFE